MHLEARGEYAQCRAEAQQIDDAYRKKKAFERCRDVVSPLIDFDALFIPDDYRTVSYIVPALAAEDILLTTDKFAMAAYEKTTRITDPDITFEETGIDYLFVDEAHHYKNLARTSDLGELACQGSNRATDLDFKLRALRERKTLSAERAGVATSTYLPAVATFATGTPVSNSMSEMW